MLCVYVYEAVAVNSLNVLIFVKIKSRQPLALKSGASFGNALLARKCVGFSFVTNFSFHFKRARTHKRRPAQTHKRAPAALTVYERKLHNKSYCVWPESWASFVQTCVCVWALSLLKNRSS